MSHEPILKKPASGKWTDAYPHLGRGPISLEDCVSTEFYEKEKEHIFKKNWLYVGRTERLPSAGSYFTRELQILDTSVLIVRDQDGAPGKPAWGWAATQTWPTQRQQTGVER